jgi:hypothetical protein
VTRGFIPSTDHLNFTAGLTPGTVTLVTAADRLGVYIHSAWFDQNISTGSRFAGI